MLYNTPKMLYNVLKMSVYVQFPIITHMHIKSLKSTVRIIDIPLKPHN